MAAWALARELKRNRRLEVRVEVAGEAIQRRASLLMVGNNEYRMAGIDASTRASLSEGLLVLYVVTTNGPAQLARLIWKILTGVARHAPELDVLRVERATIATRHARIQVAFDGEVATLETPLEYRIRPKALRVFA